MIPNRTVTPQEAADFQARVATAPTLKLEKGAEARYSVLRVGFLPDKYRSAFFETTEGELYLLPSGVLSQWAHDLVAMSLNSGTNVFPTPINFGRHADGRYWADIE
jgi:hypothetical protein